MNLFVKEKKGQLSIGFNWIFVLIIGAVLLGFFFTAISSGSKSSEQKISVSLVKHFETIIFSSGQKPGTTKTYTTPEVELSFVCNDKLAYYNYKVGDLKARDTKYDILFTPETLFGESIITWTQSWKVPYSVATVMYITNKDQLFIFEQSTSTPTRKFEQLTENFVQNVSTYIIDEENLAGEIPEGYNSYTYVLFANETNIKYSDLIEENNVNIVLIYPAETDIFSYGDLFFLEAKDFRLFRLGDYDLMSDDSPSSFLSASGELEEEFEFYDNTNEFSYEKRHSGYIGKASLYGAVFSGSQELYECNMNKAVNRLLLLSVLQSNKLDIIAPDVSSLCKEQLGLVDLPGPYGVLKKIESLAEEGFDFRLIPDIYYRAEQLQEYNYDLSMSGTCPTIY